MTFKELMKAYYAGAPGPEGGVRAVVAALRDEMEFCAEQCNTCDPYKKVYDEILASDGEEAAGGDSSGEIVASPAAAPVCEWVPYIDEPLGANWWRTCRGVRHRYTFDGHHPCTSCGKPISFKSEAAR